MPHLLCGRSYIVPFWELISEEITLHGSKQNKGCSTIILIIYWVLYHNLHSLRGLLFRHSQAPTHSPTCSPHSFNTPQSEQRQIQAFGDTHNKRRGCLWQSLKLLSKSPDTALGFTRENRCGGSRLTYKRSGYNDSASNTENHFSTSLLILGQILFALK